MNTVATIDTEYIASWQTSIWNTPLAAFPFDVLLTKLLTLIWNYSMAMDRRKSTDSLIPNDKMLSTHNGSVRRICCDRELWNQTRCSVIHFKNSSLEVKRMNVHYIVIDISAWKNYSKLEQITRRSYELSWIFFWKESGNKISSWPSMTSNFLNFPVKKARELPYSTLIYLRSNIYCCFLY